MSVKSEITNYHLGQLDVLSRVRNNIPTLVNYSTHCLTTIVLGWSLCPDIVQTCTVQLGRPQVTLWLWHCFEVLYSLHYYYHTYKPWSAHWFCNTIVSITGFENDYIKLVMFHLLTKHTRSRTLSDISDYNSRRRSLIVSGRERVTSLIFQ